MAGRWIDRHMHGWTNGWAVGWIHGWKVIYILGHTEMLDTPESSFDNKLQRSNMSAACLRPLCGLFRSQRGVNMTVRNSLEAMEIKASNGAWFFSGSLRADAT